ncbi:MAG: MFS transporter [Prolixibacteraceae bacterium]|nr:MFS transporter [Prolixibacteraceae bacterium]
MEQLRQSLRDSAALRWGILLLISYVMAANYYFYDALSPLKSILQEKLGFSSSDYGWVVGFYAFPNTFLLMAILGGIILDKIGIRITGTMFVVFMLIGAFLQVYGTTDYFNQGGFGYGLFNSFLTNFSPAVKMMALGMLIFGLGAETSIVVVSKIIVKWFSGKELALAFGVNLGIARIGSALAFFLGPRLAIPNWQTPLWFALSLLLISLLGFLVYCIADVKLDKQNLAYNGVEAEEPFRLKDITDLITNRTFIYITMLCVTFYASIFPFLKYAADFFLYKFGVPETTAGAIASWLPLGTVAFTPFFGWLVDIKGKSASLMIYGSSLLVIVFLLFAFTRMNPYVLVFLLGISFSLVPAAMWPSVSKIVPLQKIGTAYGMMFSLQNLGLFAVPVVAGMILDATNKAITPEMLQNGAVLNYTPTIIMFAIIGSVGVLFAFLLKREDKTSGYGMELPSNATPPGKDSSL